MTRALRRIFMDAISRVALWIACRVDGWDTTHADACNDPADELED